MPLHYTHIAAHVEFSLIQFYTYLVEIGVKDGSDPRQQGKGDEITEAGRDRSGNVVWVNAESPRRQNHSHHDESEGEGGYGSSDEAGCAKKEAVLDVEVAAVTDAPHDDCEERGESAHNDRLALHERQVAYDHRPRLLLRVHVAQVGMSRKAGGERHLEVALETQQRGHKDEQLVYYVKYLLKKNSICICKVHTYVRILV